MPYQVDGSLWNNVFAVPGKIVDEHLKLCGGVSLKVLLFLLRRGGDVDTREIASFLNLPLADVLDAMNYWIHLGVITLPEKVEAEKTALPSGNAEDANAPVGQTCTLKNTGLAYTLLPPTCGSGYSDENAAEKGRCETDENTWPDKSEPVREGAQAHGEKPGMVRQRLSTRQINEMSHSDRNIAYLLQEAQLVLGKPLTPVATDTITALYSYYGMQPDLILMLLQYCISINKDNMRYIEKVAASWIESGIDSHEKAEREILSAAQRGRAEHKIRRLFGIQDRALTSGESEFIRKWTDEMGCSLDLIGLAFERTVEIKGKISFAYINGILQNWHSSGITAKRQALEEMQKGKGKKTRDSEASYDMQELERLITYGEV